MRMLTLHSVGNIEHNRIMVTDWEISNSYLGEDPERRAPSEKSKKQKTRETLGEGVAIGLFPPPPPALFSSPLLSSLPFLCFFPLYKQHVQHLRPPSAMISPPAHVQRLPASDDHPVYARASESIQPMYNDDKWHLLPILAPPRLWICHPPTEPCTATIDHWTSTSIVFTCIFIFIFTFISLSFRKCLCAFLINSTIFLPFLFLLFSILFSLL
jgi:hypothetical protein